MLEPYILLIFSVLIEHFNISNNHIGDTGALALAKHLRQFPTLKTLDLRYNFISDKEAIALTLDSDMKFLIGNQKGSCGTNSCLDDPFGTQRISSSFSLGF